MKSKLTITSQNTPLGCHAFTKGSDITFSLAVLDAECEKIWFYLGNDEKVIMEREVHPCTSSSGFSCDVTLNTRDFSSGDGLYFSHFEFISRGKRWYTAFDYSENCYLDDKFVNEIQLLVYDERFSSPEWLFGGNMYQIFPDRFARGGEVERHADAVYDDDWENGIPEFPARVGDAFPNNTHFGGTLYGVVDRLDYLSSLGIDCIYLNPIFEAYSNHKYDTADFLKVDRSFGGDKALSELIEKAHQRGIKVILDGVFNHVGDDSIYFDAYGKYGNGACSSTDSPYYSWFNFFNYPNEYDSWWGIKNLPKTIRSESYIRFITEQVIPKYMRLGIDGWRLDVADELEADFLDRIASAIKRIKPDAIIIGEVWEDASNKIAYDERKRYFRGAQLDAVTNYPFRNAIIDFVKYGNADFLVDTVNTLYRHYPPHKLASLMNFLGSHDTERIATVLGGDADMGEDNAVLATKRMTPEQRDNAKALLRNSYLLLASLPGVPCIYYGDEIALEGYHDPFNRRPFPESGFNDEYSRFFARVNQLRHDEPLFKAPVTKASVLSEGVARIDRIDGTDRLVVLANMSEREFSCALASDAVDVINGNEYNKNVTIPAKNVILLKTK